MTQNNLKHNSIVIGSANVDVIADITGVHNTIDRAGDFHVRVGGTAFNLALNLKALCFNPTLVSVLKKGTLFTRGILTKMEDLGLRRDGIIFRDNGIGEAGFLAHRIGGKVISAVSSSPVENTIIEPQHLECILKAADFVAADLNNSLSTLKNIIGLEKPIYLLGVSKPKVLKLVDLAKEIPADGGNVKGIFLSQHEAYELIRKLKGDSANLKVLSEIINTLWVITKDNEGVCLIQDGKIDVDLPSIQVEPIPSCSGARDAFAAGFLKAKHADSRCNLEATKEALQYSKKYTAAIQADESGKYLLANVDEIIFKDSMTNLYNRRYYDEEKLNIEHASGHASQEMIAVALLDIDNFKSCNDTFGHGTGDVVIKTLANVIRANIRNYDIAVRYGGEEFLIIFRNCSLMSAYHVANRIRVKFGFEPIMHEGKAFSKTLSGGVAMFTNVFTDLDKAIKKADEALYAAKQSGKNKICISQVDPSVKAITTIQRTHE